MVNLPVWLYEPLPYLYTCAGTGALWRLDDMLGEISGLLLISAGLVIASMRREYRKLLKQSGASHKPGA